MTHIQQAQDILQAVRAAAQAAWGVEKVYMGPPAQRVTSLPYITLKLVGWKQDFSGAAASLTQTNATVTISIIGRFPFPTDPTERLQSVKLDRLGILLAHIQAGSSLAGGMLPIITGARFSESDTATNGAYEIEATFQAFTRAPHHG